MAIHDVCGTGNLSRLGEVMRIGWYSNAPWAASGYGVQTKMVARKMREAGHEVFIMANCGLEGSSLRYDGNLVLPSSPLVVDAGVRKFQIEQHRMDVVMSFYDVWCMVPGMLGPRWCPWFPCDREPMTDLIADPISNALLPIACSRSGLEQATARGIDALYVPCAVDTTAYGPRDRQAARDLFGIAPSTYVVGMVADNKGWPSRKAIAQQIQAFAAFHESIPDSKLFIHTCLSQARGGIDVMALCRELGIEDAILAPNQSAYWVGLPTDYMCAMYNTLDVLLAVTCDEGFGVPIIEAQACGVPVIVGGWTAMPELVGAGWVVGKDSAERTWNLQGGWQYTAHVKAITDALREAHGSGEDHSEDARNFALGYDINLVFEEYWKPVLEHIEEMIARMPGSTAATYQEAVS